ncbi:hypothetical protein B5F76_02930 [Desulfovibrio sp. An276]|uniref:serine/threonine-protein kinase n=1 Tax=Desulfovibrio sp. An276 TaxID=1965618 RepID=UPI000B387E8D|nr:serine/threonine-protein kinase [Desulfovibrio sp. An276]OUO54415.1 hypothetical protein B5F76_02930 [Desulfovibrio sp. An276]
MSIETRQVSLKIGILLHQRYKINSILGRGGFSITYTAIDKSLGRTVAIKEYFPQNLTVREGVNVYINSAESKESFEAGLKSFLEEARNLAYFRHPNICSILDYFQENNTAYLVMPYLEGDTLDSILNKCPQKTISSDSILKWLPSLLDALQTLHSKGLLHRDIKPSNIYITYDGKPILIDFGAARNAFERTHGYTIILTPEYAPPEQNSSDIASQGPWTDIYAVGAVLWKCLLGNPPPSSQERIVQIASSNIDPLDKLKKQLYNIAPQFLADGIINCLILDYKKRIHGIRELKEILNLNKENDNKNDPKIISNKTNTSTEDFEIIQQSNITEEHKYTEKKNISKETSTKNSNNSKLLYLLSFLLIAIPSFLLIDHLNIFPNSPEKIVNRENQICSALIDNYNVAIHLYNSKYYSSSYHKFIDVINSSCKRHDRFKGAASNILGIMNKFGMGVEKNSFDSIVFFKEASKYNNDAAQLNLAKMYLEGDDVERNVDQGLYYLKISAYNNNTDAILLLATIYETGAFGENKNLREAFSLYSHAVNNLKSNNNKIIQGYNRLKKYF